MDNDNYWYATMTNYLKEDLHMTSTTEDLAYFVHFVDGGLWELIYVHMKYSIAARDEKFIHESRKTKKTFESTNRE